MSVSTSEPTERILEQKGPDIGRGSAPLVEKKNSGMRRLSSEAAEICREMWQYRELLYQFTLRDIRVRYKQSAMGLAWAVFMPVMIVLSGTIVKYALAYVSQSPLDTTGISGMLVKALPWAFFVGALNFSTGSLINNQGLVTRVYFPREVCPASSVLAQCFDTSIGAAAALLALPLLGVFPAWSWLWMLVLVPLLIILTLAAALLLSCGNLFFRDVKYLVQVVITFGIFFTPVFYEPSMFGAGGGQLMMLNPLAPLLEGFRLCLVEGHNLWLTLSMVDGHGATQTVWTPWYLFYSGVWAGVGLGLSAIVFHRAEFLFAEYI